MKGDWRVEGGVEGKTGMGDSHRGMRRIVASGDVRTEDARTMDVLFGVRREMGML
jgi:hypothetical protein